jgi:hypothetical protein
MVEVLHYLNYIGRLEEYMNADNRIGEAIRYYWDYMHQDEEKIKWRAARRMRTKFFNTQESIHRSYPVKDLTLKGWNAEKRVARKMTSRQASMLVLTGEGKRPVEEPVDIEVAT